MSPAEICPETAWTVIREVAVLPPARRGELLGQFLRRYWKPIYAYALTYSKSTHDAEEAVQGFLCDFVAREKILSVAPEAGRFRDWLLVCFRNYLRSEWRRKRAAKRQPKGGLLSLDSLKAGEGEPYASSDFARPEDAFIDAWRRDLLAQALKTVGQLCEQQGRKDDYQIFLAYYCHQDDRPPTWEAIARRYSLPDWKLAARKADWVKSKLRDAIRTQIAGYVESPTAIDSEIRDLFQP